MSLLPFEPTIFPKLQVNFADFPYLRFAIWPEASNLEDLMRLSVRRLLKIKYSNTRFFMGHNGLTLFASKKKVF